MTRYLIGRIAQVIPTALLVSVVVFLMLHMAPGDPVAVILSAKAVAYTEDDVIALREQLGLDKPLIAQYLAWVGNAVRGDLGTSLYLRRDIRPLLFERLGATAILAAGALLFALPVGIIGGVVSSLLKGTIWDRLINAVIVMGVAVPVFALGLF
ncbi:MAG: ABC transporter permease, partial [Thermomicrobiales bacterium]|nr:ABC transporter permease [Thermomicrobiales bacterium]